MIELSADPNGQSGKLFTSLYILMFFIVPEIANQIVMIMFKMAFQPE